MTAGNDYFDLLADDWYFEQLDDLRDGLTTIANGGARDRYASAATLLRRRNPSPPAALRNSPVVGAAAVATRADRPAAPPLPGGRSALILHNTRADCHPWEPAARWHDGQRICWPCLQTLLTEREAPGPLHGPGADDADHLGKGQREPEATQRISTARH
jgi:hypothetical protein